MKYNLQQKIELEAILLNTVLNYSESFKEFIGIINTDEVFDKPEHKTIYNDCVKFFTEKGKAPSYAEIFESQISSKENRTQIKEYLINIMSRANVEIRDAANIAKRIIDLKAEFDLREYQSRCIESGLDYVQAVSNKTLEINNKYLSGIASEKSNLEVAETVITRIMKGAGNNFIKTGFDKIDKYTNGIPKNHITIVAGRPGTGKTTFMLQLFRNFISQGLRVGIFSLEMTAESLLIKNISSATGIDSLKIESINLTREEKFRLAESAKLFISDNYKVIDLSVQTPAAIKAQINLWKIRNQVDVVMIDYLTLIKTDYRLSRQDLEIGKLSSEINSVAKSTGIPILILSQLNRQSESRLDKRPQLSDLKESGTIEQDANLVLLLYRPGLYNIDATKNEDYSYSTQDGAPLSPDEYFEVIIAKARNGRTGSVPLRFRPEIHTFEPVRAEPLTEERLPGEYEALISKNLRVL